MTPQETSGQIQVDVTKRNSMVYLGINGKLTNGYKRREGRTMFKINSPPYKH